MGLCPLIQVFSFTFLLLLLGWGVETSRMGNNFSHPSLTPSEQDVYFQVKNTVIVGQFKFSKGNLKSFIHWIFKFFPNTNADSILSRVFWDNVGSQLNVVQLNKDLSVFSFISNYY